MNFNDEDIETMSSPYTEHLLSHHKMTHLMKLCLMTNKYPQLNIKIGKYLVDNQNEIDKKIVKVGQL